MTDWTPPDGMNARLAQTWRAFYSGISRNYGMTPVHYRALYLAQAGRCYICRTAKGMHPDDPKGNGGRRLGVDHNHLLGNALPAVRGLLCTGGDRTCNRIIGWLNVAQLDRAAYYLRRPPAVQVLEAVRRGATDEDLRAVLGIA